MTILTEDNLRRTAEVAMTRASWREIGASVGASESAIYNWLSRSKRDEAQNARETSPFYVSVDPHGFDYWHNHIKHSRAAFILGMEAEIRDQVRSGIVETCMDPSTGRPLLALNPEFIGLSDAEMEAQFLNPAIDRYMWHRDAQGKRTAPIYQTKVTQAPGQLKIKALSSLLPTTWGERATVEHNLAGQVVHVFQPAPFVSKQQRIASGEITDAEYTEVQATGLERPDIAEMRALAARKAATPLSERRTVPEGFVLDACGQPVNVGRKRVIDDPPDDVPLHKPEAPLRENPRAYEARPPAPATPPRRYSEYPAGTDPHRDGVRAMKITR